MYRHHPGTTLARQLVADGASGTLKHIRSALTVSVPEGDIRRSRSLGGGALLDLGCYCVSATRRFAGTPERVYAEAVHDDGPDGVDLRFSATMRLPGGVLAQFDAGVDLPRRGELELIGSAGRIILSDPWLCREKTIELVRHDGTHEHLLIDPTGRFALQDDGAVYRHEFEVLSETVRNGTEAAFARADAIDQARVIEALRHSSEQAAPVRLGT
ncbi:Gfo/Idh/MocA family oxidoreductase [Streptomyces acidicola]|uniref:Gfo/Idh/MocA family protein n=1 Tax=Streptomyces acidicola TaxID=2596892 RepID=UPI0037A86EC6